MIQNFAGKSSSQSSSLYRHSISFAAGEGSSTSTWGTRVYLTIYSDSGTPVTSKSDLVSLLYNLGYNSESKYICTDGFSICGKSAGGYKIISCIFSNNSYLEIPSMANGLSISTEGSVSVSTASLGTIQNIAYVSDSVEQIL